MKFFKFALLISFTGIFLSSCDNEPGPGTLRIQFEMSQDGTPINLNQDYAGDQVTAMRIEKLKFYISDLEILGSGSTLREVEVVDFGESRTAFTFNDVASGTYSGLNYTLGLSPEQNASDPVQYASDHPLSASWGLYWGWATKYRFILLEGRAAPDGNIDGAGGDFFISMHPGADEFAQLVSNSRTIEIQEGKTTTLTIQIDVDDMFDGPGGLVDLPNENQTHTTASDRYIAEKFIENFAAAMVIK